MSAVVLPSSSASNPRVSSDDQNLSFKISVMVSLMNAVSSAFVARFIAAANPIGGMIYGFGAAAVAMSGIWAFDKINSSQNALVKVSQVALSMIAGIAAGLALAAAAGFSMSGLSAAVVVATPLIMAPVAGGIFYLTVRAMGLQKYLL